MENRSLNLGDLLSILAKVDKMFEMMQVLVQKVEEAIELMKAQNKQS